MRNGKGCHLCERADSITKGAKCALHESATSPPVDRGDKPTAAGPLGPPCVQIMGLDRSRRAPCFDVEGRRIDT